MTDYESLIIVMQQVMDDGDGLWVHAMSLYSFCSPTESSLEDHQFVSFSSFSLALVGLLSTTRLDQIKLRYSILTRNVSCVISLIRPFNKTLSNTKNINMKKECH